jgi:hypothetical protein
MLNSHIFFVIIATIILIIIAEYQKLRNITWILIIGCITYTILTLTPDFSNPINHDTNVDLKIQNIDSLIVHGKKIVTNQPIQNKTDAVEKRSFPVLIDTNEPHNSIQTLSVKTIAIATEVIEKNPVGTGTLFLNDINVLFCHTSINNNIINNKIIHTWEFEGQDYLKSFLTIGESQTWRCWSRITIRPEMIGDWNVSVTDTLGNILDSIEFTILSANE